MATELVLAEIFQNLPASQIDKLRTSNRDMNEFISNNRARFPLTPIDYLNIPFYSNSSPETSYSQLCTKHVRKVVKGGNVDDYINHLKVKILESGTEEAVMNLPLRFLRNVEGIRINSIKNKEDFDKVMSKLTNCSSVCFPGTEFEVNADEVLAKMASVHKFVVVNGTYSPKFIEKLIEKSKTGPGIRRLVLKNEREDSSFTVDQIVELIEKAEFLKLRSNRIEDMIRIQIDAVSGTVQDMTRKLEKMQRRNAAINTIFNAFQLFRIDKSSSEIYLHISEFL